MLDAIIGGLLIGTSALILMFFYGRIAGISDIFFSGLDTLNSRKQGVSSIVFIFGLMLGSILYYYLANETFPKPEASFPLAIAAGFLVGFGTRIGSGCTSGHGVCGTSRFSLRSICATITFMLVGMLTVGIFKYVF